MTRRLALAAILCAIAAATLAQNTTSNFERGFAPDKVYNFGNIDNVNMFNGNLVLTIPIGTSYPIGGGSSYRLILTYNSTVWEHVNVIPMQDLNDGTRTPQSWSYPNRTSNAGFGWQLSLGRILNQYDASNILEGMAYLSSDGNAHRFVPTTATITRDGSYLRWHPPGQSTQSGTLDTPDGSTSTFYVANGAPAANGYGILTHLTDPYGNWVDISPTVVNGLVTQWTITDNAGRTHRVYFKSFSGTTTINSFPGSTSQTNYQTVVDRVELQVPSGYATYQFVYKDDAGNVDQPTTIPGGADSGTPLGWPMSYSLPFLREIQLPDGSKYVPTYVNLQNETVADSGQIKSLRIPTGGKITWEYGTYQFASEPCAQRGWRHSNIGVTKRTLDSGVSLQSAEGKTAVWTYTPAFGHMAPDVQCYDENGIPKRIAQEPLEVVRTMTKPDGHQEIYHFTAAVTEQEETVSPAKLTEYGSPQYRKWNDGTARKRGLSVEYKDVTTGRTRKKFLQYVYNGTTFNADQSIASIPDDGDGRVRSERMLYPDDNNATTTVDTDYDDFDGYGHYRKTTVTSSAYPNAVRTAYTNFNPGSTTLDPNRANWILNTFTDQWVSQYGHTAKTENCFDSKGFLAMRRVLAGDAATDAGISRAANDILMVFTRTPDTDPAYRTWGNVVRESYYGGDPLPPAYAHTQDLGPSALAGTAGSTQCTFAVPSVSPVYDLRHTYAYGVRESSTYYSAGASVGFKSLDLTVDTSGAVTSERDSAGVQTTFGYTTWGAISSITPPTGNATSYTYTNATVDSSGAVTSPASVSMTRGDTRTDYFFDGLGRFWRDFTLTASGSGMHETYYDGMSRKIGQSDVRTGSAADSWNASFANVKRSTITYDGFGRTKNVQAPDNSVSRFEYPTAMETKRFVTVHTVNGDQEVMTKEKTDGLGQLVTVTEPSGTNGADMTATYSYDAAGRLIKASLSSGGVTQNDRLFTYDNRGFLLSEKSPEVDEIDYGSYDPRGHFRVRSYPGDTTNEFRLESTYDAAERLTRQDTYRYGNLKPFKVFTYATSGTYSTGKLLSAVRHNYLPTLGDMIVTETYSYGEPGGRISSKQTAIAYDEYGNDPWEMQRLTQSYEYNAMGQRSKTVYPVCSTDVGLALCGEPVWDEVQFQYTKGLMSKLDALRTRPTTQVFPLASSITYYADGMKNQIYHSNGVVDEVTRDDGMARPTQIQFSGSSTTCAPPKILDSVTTRDVTRGTSVQLSVSVTGSSPLTFRWYDSAGTLLFTGTTFTTPVVNAAATYTVQVTNTCGAASAAITVTPVDGTPLAVPTNVSATYTGTQVKVTWTASANATTYEVFRKTNIYGAFTYVGNSSGSTTLYDPAITANAAYVYAVQAINGSTRSAMSGGDVVLVRTFTSVATQTSITTTAVEELRTSIALIATSLGITGSTEWTAILPAGVPVPARGVYIYAEHFTALRTRLDSVFRSAGVSPAVYTNQSLLLQPIHAIDVTEMQQAMGKQ